MKARRRSGKRDCVSTCTKPCVTDDLRYLSIHQVEYLLINDIKLLVKTQRASRSPHQSGEEVNDEAAIRKQLITTMDSDEWVEKFTSLLAEAESDEDSSLSEGSPHKRVIDFLEDDTREMTNGRRLALSLMDHNWYNPRAGRSQVEEIKTLASAFSQMEVEGGLKKVDDFDATMSNSEPNLALAWAYFEHVSLYRYLVPKDEAKQNKRCCHKLRDRKLDKAEPGENDDPTRLYHPIFTPHSQLGDFGLGIGLYFTSLRAITLITFMAGLVSLYNIMYFASDA